MLLVFLAAFVLVARSSVAVGEWYATTVYPVVSAALSWSVSWIPFSMEEVLVVVVVLWVVWIVWRGIRNGKNHEQPNVGSENKNLIEK